MFLRYFSLRFLLLLILGAMVPGGAVAQPEHAAFVRLSAAEGLSQSTVTAMLQDRRGLVWAGTQDGLNRFDGYRFRAYRTGDAGLVNAYIRALAEDSAGNIWVGTDYGLARFDPHTERFTTYLPRPEQPGGLPDRRINALLVSGHELLIGTQTRGLCRLDLRAAGSYQPGRARFRTQRPSAASGLLDSCLQVLTPTGDGRIWVGTSHIGIQRYTPRTGKFEAFPGPVEGRWNVWDVCLGEGRTVWLASTQGLFEFDPTTRQFRRHLSDVAEAIYAVRRDKAGNLWVGQGESGLRCRPANGNPDRLYQHDPADPASLAASFINALFIDRTGSVWVSTGGAGLSRYDAWRQPLRAFTAENGRSVAFESGVRAFGEAADGRLWLAAGATADLMLLDPRTGANRRWRVPRCPGVLEAYTGTNVLRVDARGRVWLATVADGLVCFDPQTEQFTHLMPVLAAQGITGTSSVSDLDFDPAGRVWIGTAGGGVVCWEEATRTARAYTAGPQQLQTSNVLSVAADPRTGHIWVGTWGGGLHRIEPQTGSVVQYPLDPEAPTALPAAAVLTVLPDEATGRGVWVGTANGLYRAESAKGPFRRVAGLAPNIIFRVSRDPSGAIWVGGQENFARVTGTEVQNYAFAAAHLRSYGSLFCTRAGQVLVSTNDGMIGFRAHDLPSGQRQRTLVTGIDILNKPVAPSAAGYAVTGAGNHDEVTLQPDQNVLTIHFTALNFAEAEQNRYFYRLNGFDPAGRVVSAGTERAATYTNLPPGDYQFIVGALTGGGTSAALLRDRRPTVFHIHVLPPWYRTWWAYAAYALLLAGAVWLTARLWLARQRNQLALSLKETEAARLAELDQVKTRFFTNISHEFRTPLTLILGPLERWRTDPAPDPRRRREEDAMRRNARRLLELISQLLDITKLEAGALRLHPTPTDLGQLARALTYSFASLADSRGIQLTYEAATDLPILPLDGDKIEKVLTNLVANALKFTPAGGAVRVTVEVAPTHVVRLRVQDTGVGIEPDRLPFVFDRFYQADNSATRAYEGTGIGLALVKELVALHGGTVRAESRVGEGTTFTVELPLGAENLQTGGTHVPGGGTDVPGGSTDVPGGNTDVPGGGTDVPGGGTDVPGDFDPDSTPDDVRPLILLVEDHPDVRAYLRDQFAPAVYRLLEAPDGQAGLELALAHLPDLIITDLMMPRLDGVELTRALKTNLATNHIPVILLTAKASVESRLEGLETGADDYLTKPFQPAELTARVRNLIETRRRLREKYSREIREVREIKLHAAEVTVQSADDRFIQRALAVVEEHLAEEEFDVEAFASAMALSRVQLYRKLKTLTDQTPTDFIRTLRLGRAAQLLRQQMGTVAEVAYAVGFQNLSYFAKTFKELHGVAPSEWADQSSASSPEKLPPTG
jgi:signal transduction histidine kinase/ligand-binding sensor domain-containing protein/DNA-binding response OmpR family regulator